MKMKMPHNDLDVDEQAISLIGAIVLILLLVVTLLYGGPILDWLDTL